MDLGQVAYEAYLASCDGKSIRGEDLPTWNDHAPEIRAHWRAAADGVKMFLEMRPPGAPRNVASAR
jgi:hypothetical protein